MLLKGFFVSIARACAKIRIPAQHLFLFLLLLGVSPYVSYVRGATTSTAIISSGAIQYPIVNVSSTDRLIGFNYMRTSTHWNSYMAYKEHFDLTEGSGSNMVRLGINVWAWKNNPLVDGSISYRDHLAEVIGWIHDLDCVVILCPLKGDEISEDWTRARKIEYILTPSLQVDWINTLSDAISTLNIEGFDLFNEPPPAKFSPISLSDIEYFNLYRDFMVDCVQAYRTIDPDLMIFIESAPFWDLSFLANNPLDEENVYYVFHAYPDSVYNFPRGQLLIDAWETDPEEAKRIWKEYILTTGYYATLGCIGKGVQAIIDAGLTPYNMEMGCTLDDPHWQEWMVAHYDIMDELGIGYSHHQLKPNPNLPNRFGMQNPEGTAFNEIGILWYENMQSRYVN